MSRLLAAALALLLAVAVTAGLALGWHQAAQRATEAELRATEAENTVAVLQAAKKRGDELAVRVDQAERANVILTREKDDALRRATVGRPCLGGAALRVLNGAPGLRVQSVPAAAGNAAAAHAAAAAGTGQPAAEGSANAAAEDTGLSSTDTQVGAWMLAAGAQYEACRGRLDALIDYIAPGTPP